MRQAIAATRRGGVVSLAGVCAGWVHGPLLGDVFPAFPTRANRYRVNLRPRAPLNSACP
jgi:hypothetical protein